MGMERGHMRKEQDNQSSGKVTAKIARKTAAAASTFPRGNEDPFDSDFGPIPKLPRSLIGNNELADATGGLIWAQKRIN